MKHPLKLTLLAFLIFAFSHDGYTSEKITIDGSTGVKPLVESLIKQYKNAQPNVVIEVGKGLNPEKRIRALLNKNINIAMASHGIDIQQISQRGLKVHRIAKIAVIIGVNETVSIHNITDRQLCDVYSGKRNSWDELEGTKSPIIPMLRPFNEVDTEVITAHIPCFSKVQFPADILTYKKSGQMARAISQTPGAVGMTTMVRAAQSNGKIRALSINGVTPNTKNLLSGAYPFTRDSFLITSSKPSQEVTAFLAFVRSEQGSAIIIENNAIPAN